VTSRRTWFVWHSWIGLTAGLMLFVICWSGAVAVFSYELDWLLNPALQAAPSDHVDWTAIKAKAEAAFPAASVFQVGEPLAPGYAAEVILLYGDDFDFWLAYADPATGAILGDSSYFNIQRFFRSFHMNLFFLSGNFNLGFWGYRIVEFFSLVLIASAVSSLVFYRRWWRGFFKLETKKGPRVFWSDVHKLTGLWSLWFVLPIAITGIWYFVEEFAPDSPLPPEVPALPVQAATRPDLNALIATAEAALPNFHVTRVIFDGEDGLVDVYGYDDALLVRDRSARVWLDPRDGSVLGTQRASDLTLYERWIDTADPLHFGNFGGLASKLIWFFFGLTLSALSLTGAYLQVKRQQKRTPYASTRTPVRIAYGLTLALLLVSAVGGWYEIRDYGFPMGGEGAFPPVPLPVAAFIGLWVFSTLGALTLWMVKLR
jgi:uncharacterized iron-regulated membrane protein